MRLLYCLHHHLAPPLQLYSYCVLSTMCLPSHLYCMMDSFKMKDFIVFFAPLICKEVLFGSKCKPRITKTMHNILESFVQQSSEFHVSWYTGTIPVLYVTFLPRFCRTFLERRKREYSNHERTQRESSKHGYAPFFEFS